MLVKRFDRAIRKVEPGEKKIGISKRNPKTEEKKTNKKLDLQCHECKGYGHFKIDFPTVRR